MVVRQFHHARDVPPSKVPGGSEVKSAPVRQQQQPMFIGTRTSFLSLLSFHHWDESCVLVLDEHAPISPSSLYEALLIKDLHLTCSQCQNGIPHPPLNYEVHTTTYPSPKKGGGATRPARHLPSAKKWGKGGPHTALDILS